MPPTVGRLLTSFETQPLFSLSVSVSWAWTHYKFDLKAVRQHILMMAHWTPRMNVTMTYSASQHIYLNVTTGIRVIQSHAFDLWESKEISQAESHTGRSHFKKPEVFFLHPP